MSGYSMRENREIRWTPRQYAGLGRMGKAKAIIL